MPAGSSVVTDTITLLSDVTLTTFDNSGNFGENGLPEIGSAITIEGAGYTISRAANAPAFRFFFVNQSSILTLNRLTLHNGNGNSTFGNAGGALLNNFGTVTVRAAILPSACWRCNMESLTGRAWAESLQFLQRFFPLVPH